jgi:hypothetical protein
VQELLDFIHFQECQLMNVDFTSGQIDVWMMANNGKRTRTSYDVGSLSQDGYVRVWCNGRLRMKHRLLFFLYHGYVPCEVDHDNNIRNDNCITNLIDSIRSENTKDKTPRTFKQLKEPEVHDLCKDHVSGNYSITDLASKYGRSRVQIKAILSKKYWSKVSDHYF